MASANSPRSVTFFCDIAATSKDAQQQSWRYYIPPVFSFSFLKQRANTRRGAGQNAYLGRCRLNGLVAEHTPSTKFRPSPKRSHPARASQHHVCRPAVRPVAMTPSNDSFHALWAASSEDRIMRVCVEFHYYVSMTSAVPPSAKEEGWLACSAVPDARHLHMMNAAKRLRAVDDSATIFGGSQECRASSFRDAATNSIRLEVVISFDSIFFYL